MANNRVRINHAAAKAILQSPETMRELRRIAEQITANTGQPDDYVIEEWVGRNRARVSVWTKTARAKRNEATDHTLLRALGSTNG